jgi:hypothetical protein
MGKTAKLGSPPVGTESRIEFKLMFREVRLPHRNKRDSEQFERQAELLMIHFGLRRFFGPPMIQCACPVNSKRSVQKNRQSGRAEQ